jgi:hypothetical protein
VTVSAESGTEDTLETITATGASAGDLMILTADTGDLIDVVDSDNVENSHVLYGSAPSLLLYTGASWRTIASQAGWKEVCFPAESIAPAESSPCGDLENINSTEGFYGLPFAPSAVEYFVLPSILLPENFGGVFKWQATWAPDGTNTGNALFSLIAKYAGNGEAFGDTENEYVTDAGEGVAYEPLITPWSNKYTDGNPREKVIFQGYRMAINASDTYTGDAYLTGVNLKMLIKTPWSGA